MFRAGTKAQPTGVSASSPRSPRGPQMLTLLGPALVAGVAYLDPGNVASNLTAGARYGYLLVWVVVLANVMAWLIQYLSAKLGVVTGRSLPELLGERIRSRAARIAYWLQAELVAMATDIAEVIGGAVALNLLFGLPLVAGGVITGIVSMVLLAVQNRRGPRVFEFVIMGLLAIIAIGFSAGVVLSPPDAGSLASGLLPRFQDAGSVLLAASILGATIMPHAIYAHSALARDRWAFTRLPDSAPTGATAPAAVPEDTDSAVALPNLADATEASVARPSFGSAIGKTGRASGAARQADAGAGQATAGARQASAGTRQATAEAGQVGAGARQAGGYGIPLLLRATRWDVSLAMVIAGTVNLCILLLAAANLAGVPGTDSLEGAYAAIAVGLGPVVAILFAVGLLASGLASTSVGAYAGAEIMHGLLHARLPLLTRRLITLVPAIGILALGLDPTLSLVISQVVLSFGIPFALVPLVTLTARRDLLGQWSNRWTTTVAGVVASVLLIALNGTLLWLLLA